MKAIDRLIADWEDELKTVNDWGTIVACSVRETALKDLIAKAKRYKTEEGKHEVTEYADGICQCEHRYCDGTCHVDCPECNPNHIGGTCPAKKETPNG